MQTERMLQETKHWAPCGNLRSNARMSATQHGKGDGKGMERGWKGDMLNLNMIHVVNNNVDLIEFPS